MLRRFMRPAVALAVIIGLLVYTHDDGSGDRSGQTEVVEAYHRTKLDAMIPEFRFDGVPLERVIDTLGQRTGARFIVDWPALEAAGVARGVPITRRLREQPLWMALELVLVRAAPQATPDFVAVEEGAILITTRVAVGRGPVVARVHDVRDLINESVVSQLPVSSRTKKYFYTGRKPLPIERLRNFVMSVVTTDGWGWSNSLPEVQIIGGHLLVVQTWENQLQIESVLHELHEAVAARGRDARPTTRSAELFKRAMAR